MTTTPTMYVALLRGINVGGKNKVEMKKLKTTFEQAGMQSVSTYINSGNIVFASSLKSRKRLARLLEKAIYEDFGLAIRVVIRSKAEYQKVIGALPKSWSNDNKQKSDVMFLWDEIDKPSLIQELPIKAGLDKVKYVPGAILWMTQRQDVTKSGKMKLASLDLYQKMTVRNVNTTQKIWELLDTQWKK